MRIPVKVTLTLEECIEAVFEGAEQYTRNCFTMRRPVHMASQRDPWESYVVGSLGERAFCKALDLPWSRKVSVPCHAPDRGGVQIRTPKPGNRNLFFKPKDNPDEVYVLVTGDIPNYSVEGWVWGRDGMQDKYKHDSPGNVYFIFPASQLNDIETCHKFKSFRATQGRVF